MAVIKIKNDDKWEYIFAGQTQSGFPEFTESDNGKVLTIVNGVIAWAEATGGSGAVEDLQNVMEVAF